MELRKCDYSTQNNVKGKTCIITGPTHGIGRATALTLGKLGASLFLLCRNIDKGQNLAAEIEATGGSATVIHADLASLASVYSAASTLQEKAPKIDLLINNAGVLNGEKRITEDGFEEMFAVNYLAHFLLTTKLLPLLKAAESARIIHVASGAYAFVKAFDFDDYNWQKKTFRAFPAYGHSKLANMLFNHKLAKNLSRTQITSNALDPGNVATGMGTINPVLKLINILLTPFMLTPEQGASTSIYLAVHPDAEAHNGKYFIKNRLVSPSPNALDDHTAERLWEMSESLLEKRGFSSQLNS